MIPPEDRAELEQMEAVGELDELVRRSNAHESERLSKPKPEATLMRWRKWPEERPDDPEKVIWAFKKFDSIGWGTMLFFSLSKNERLLNNGYQIRWIEFPTE